MQINEYIIFLILITVILILLFPIAKTIDLVDRPSDRKSHAGNIPLTGGLAIGIYLLILVKYFEFYTQIEQIFIYGFLICLIGSVDDKCNISVSKKLLFQSITVLILIYESNLLLNNLGYFKYLGLLSLGKFNIIFTLLCVILLINAVNYSDGIDGNASFITISSLLIIFFLIKLFEIQNLK
jgi:UDP-GlcNAc:undecaprenyl-phosphate GlcNAc-1-phosphate transferase